MKIKFYLEEEVIEEINYKSTDNIIITNLVDYKSENCFSYKFKGIKANYWKIINYEILKNNKELNLYIKEEARLISLKDHAERNNKGVGFYLKKYSIVDVNFGYHKNILNTANMEIEKNEIYLDKLMKEELHKIRPCIVLSVEGDKVQVIPLTTQEKSPKEKINLNNLRDKINAFYLNKDSYIIPNMIQTVSSRRVFPPKNINGTRKQSYDKYMINTDMKNLINKLLNQRFNPNIQEEKNKLEKDKKKLSEEKFKLIEKIKRLELENNELMELKKLIEEDFDIKGNTIKEFLKNYKEYRN